MEDDRILMARIAGGDQRSFDVLVRRYYSTLYAVALNIIHDPAEAEDTVQDIFANLWKHRRKYTAVHSPKDYLFITMRNLAVKRLREKNRSESFSDNHKIAFDDYWEHVLEQDTYRLLIEAVESLPLRSREVIKNSLAGMRQEKIAEEMGITVATVKALKADGIKKLKQLLGPLAYLVLMI
ncbi:MAG: sigma-70 family RNA polymerase sigma factor [Rikenellaceae bacterium]|nr:sigma-70 family RNA polymerase sigma factor [Rikenellaceae bacterium]MCL2693210.1 sigma-70 family RNA polymerase sigma factor [Rikenellaceae bacterium]